MNSKKRILIIFLILSTLVLGGISIYVGMTVSNEQNDLAPDDSSAATNCKIDGVTDCDDDTGLSYCGSACKTDADCIEVGANGTPVECRAGKCESKFCPNTEAGANCDCKVGTATCGERCGNGYPLCGPGSECRYITGPQCTEQNVSQKIFTTFCVPDDHPAIEITRCQDPRDGANSYVSQGSKTTFTQDEIKALCNPVCGNGFIEEGEECDDGDENGTSVTDCTTSCVFNNGSVCGNSIVEAGESCDLGTNNGVAGYNCTSTCQNLTECSDGIDNDNDGKIDCNAVNPDPGCFPNGMGGGGACNPLDNSEKDATPLPATGINEDIPIKVIVGIGLILLGYQLYKGSKSYKNIRIEI